VRERDDTADRVERPAAAAAGEQATEGSLLPSPDVLETRAGRSRQARLVRRPPMLVEVDPARVRGDLDETHPEAGTADVDVAQCDLARHEREAVLVLLPARVLPGGEEEDRDQEQDDHAHLTCIGRVRPHP